jgi:hypothetical protein
MRDAKGLDSAAADHLGDAVARVSMSNWNPVLEHAHHHELSLSRRSGRNKMQLAVYSDRRKNPALNGTGNALPVSSALLPDTYAGTFSFTGHDYNTRGVRAVYERKLTSRMAATVDYSYGGVLDVAPFTPLEETRDSTVIRQRHALAYKMSGTLPRCKTKWVASYRWTKGSAITSVDMFNSGPGQADPYLSLFIKQPIPGTGFMPGHMEALVDVRNLLAQGYVPVVGSDGSTLYLVQSARALRGGISFTF